METMVGGGMKGSPEIDASGPGAGASAGIGGQVSGGLQTCETKYRCAQ